MPNQPRARKPLLIGALLLLSALAISGAVLTIGPRVEVGILVSEGKPREVAECMVQLRQSWGQCEVGMFTGTYPARWDSLPELRAVRDAVAGLRRRSGEWSFADHRLGAPWTVCANLPGGRRACSVNVQSAFALALGDPAPTAPPPGGPPRLRALACQPAQLPAEGRRRGAPLPHAGAVAPLPCRPASFSQPGRKVGAPLAAPVSPTPPPMSTDRQPLWPGSPVLVDVVDRRLVFTLREHEVFVFGSNRAGFHGAGGAGIACRGDADVRTWRTDKAFTAMRVAPRGSERRDGVAGRCTASGAATRSAPPASRTRPQTIERPGRQYRRGTPRRTIYA